MIAGRIPRLALVAAWFLAASLLGGCKGVRRLKCERPIGEFSAGPGDIVWFGEMHGTAESLRFVGDAACHAARSFHVQVGLEIPQEETLRIQQYLRDGDRASLLAGPFWAHHDGRSSEAMVDLLDRVRHMRTYGGRIEVVAFDITDEPDRDAAMARAVIAARNPGAVFVGLSGNIHSRRTPWRDQVPLVAHLVAEKLPVKTYDVAARGGTIWACIRRADQPGQEPVCGEHPMNDHGDAGPVWSLGPPRDDSHDGVYRVGATTASPPANPPRT